MPKLSYFNILNGKYHNGMSIKQLFVHFNNTLSKARVLTQLKSPYFLNDLASLPVDLDDGHPDWQKVDQ